MLFFGTENFSAAILQRLIDTGFPIEAVITKPDTASGRGQKVVPPAVKVIAEAHDIRVLQPIDLNDIMNDITSYGRPAAVLASYGKIVPQSVLDLFQPGIINVHPSLLPAYRGASPIETAILNGDFHTGVSIMKLVNEMDAGPVYAQTAVTFDKETPVEELYDTMAKSGANLLIQSLPHILDGSLQPHEQNGEPTFTQKIKKSDGIIDWHKPAEEIRQQINAYHDWPQSRALIGKLEVIITSAHAVPSDFGNPGELDIEDEFGILMIQTGDGYLCIDAVKPLGKKEMPIRAFLQGYKNQL